MTKNLSTNSSSTLPSIQRRLGVKTIVIASALLAILCVPRGAAEAAQYSGTGTVAVLRSHDAAISLDWFALTGVASLGACPAVNGSVVIVIKDDLRGQRHLAIALAAKMAGMPLTVWVDDTNLDSTGYCYLEYLQ